MRVFNGLAYLHGREITALPPLVGIHQPEWKGRYGLQSAEHLRRIIRNVSDYIVASYPPPEDNHPPGTHDPRCFLRSIKIAAGGNPERIPKTFEALTGDHTFETHDPDGDTVVLVDVTSHPSYRKERRGHDMIEYALMRADALGIPYRFTFSPYRKNYFELARNLHADHGAKPLLILPRARPGLRLFTKTFGDVLVEDVMIMGYPNFIPQASPSQADLSASLART